MEENMAKADLLGFLLSLKAELEKGDIKQALEIIDRVIRYVEKQKRLATATTQTANLTPQQGRAESLTSAPSIITQQGKKVNRNGENHDYYRKNQHPLRSEQPRRADRRFPRNLRQLNQSASPRFGGAFSIFPSIAY
jgi:hypothetical protein